MNMDRRLFMKLTVTGGALVASYQSSVFLLAIKTPDLIQDTYAFDFLTEQDRQVLAAIIPVVLGDALKIPLEDESDKNLTPYLKELIRSWDTTLIHLAVDTQDEIRKLFDTIQGHPLFRKIIQAPMDFTHKEHVDDFLKKWSQSLNHIILSNELRYAYLALCNITTSSWYAMDDSWSVTGYKGIPPL